MLFRYIAKYDLKVFRILGVELMGGEDDIESMKSKNKTSLRFMEVK